MPLKHYYTGGFIFSGNMPQIGNGGEGEQCVTSHGTGNAGLLSCQFAVEETWIIKWVRSVSGESSPWSGISWTEGKAILSRLIKHKKVPGNYSHSNLCLIINPNSLQALKQYFSLLTWNRIIQVGREIGYQQLWYPPKRPTVWDGGVASILFLVQRCKRRQRNPTQDVMVFLNVVSFYLSFPSKCIYDFISSMCFQAISQFC